MAYININKLNYWYPKEENKTLEDIDISIDKGEVILITGKSGSGKSTLAKCISGAVPNFYGGKFSGEILVNCKNIKDLTHKERAQSITMVFQDPERQLVMNKVHREVALGLENVGIESSHIKRRVFESLQFANILKLAYRDINTLSGGEKQKVAIAAAVSYLPSIILLDEPTSQLDPTSAEEIIYLIKKINEELGITIVVIEQRISRWFEIADRVGVLSKGRIEFWGTRKELYDNNDFKEFLPSYLRVAKEFRIGCFPETFKDCRKQISLKLSQKSYENSSAYFQEEEDKNQESAIEIKKLQFQYNEIEALKGIDINIRKGDLLSILGANGAGKSTLLKSIMSLVPYKGSIKIFGKEAKKLQLKELSRIAAYVSQNPNDYISKDTVWDEVAFTLKNHGILDESIVNETLAMLGIEHLSKKNPRDISGGERQRVAIASMMVLRPNVLLLDEPTRGLDNEAKKQLCGLIKKINKDGTTVVIVTHDMDFAAELSNKFLIMFNGEMASFGSRNTVLSEGIYYSTAVNKLFRNTDPSIFTLEDAIRFYSENMSDEVQS